MSKKDTIVEFQNVRDMLGDDPKDMHDFGEAVILSFKKFKDEYSNCMHNRDLGTLREVGHRMKPAIQIIGALDLLDEYEHAKKLLINEATMKKIDQSIENMHTLCERVIAEFRRKMDDQ